MKPYLSLIVLVLSLPASDSASGESLTQWLNKQIRDQVLVIVDKTNSATKQADTSSENSNPTSLVDHSSASDLISLALNQAGFSTGDQAADSTSASATIYSLYAALKGADPLAPDFYRDHASLRRVSVSFGFDEEGVEAEKRTTRLYGLKWKIIDRRRPKNDELEKLDLFIDSAGAARGRLQAKIFTYIFTRPKMRDNVKVDFLNFLLLEERKEGRGCIGEEAAKSAEAAAETLEGKVHRLLSREFNRDGERKVDWSHCEVRYWARWVNAHAGAEFDPQNLPEPEEDQAAIRRIIGEDLDSLVALAQATSGILQRVRRAPQFALTGSYKDLPGTGRVHLGEAIFDYGLADRLTLTLNAKYEEIKDIEEEPAPERTQNSDSWEVAGQLRYQLSPETLTRKAMYLDLAGNRKRSDQDTIYKIQAKTVFPLMGGVNIPISLTYASDAELIEEDDIRGQVGFSIDLSKLVEALRQVP